MTRLLASVADMQEAELAAAQQVDLIDLKNPQAGALGALPLSLLAEIVRRLGDQHTLSATIGDLPMQPELLVERTAATIDTGVDIVKIGFFGHSGHVKCIESLSRLARHHRLVAVLLADQAPDFSLVPALAAAGFYGVMLDTANKQSGRLVHVLSEESLRQFVDDARAQGLLCGLAGSLQLEDIAQLSSLHPDYLGFRGAICAGHDRRGRLEAVRLGVLQNVLRECNTFLTVPLPA